MWGMMSSEIWYNSYQTAVRSRDIRCIFCGDNWRVIFTQNNPCVKSACGSWVNMQTSSHRLTLNCPILSRFLKRQWSACVKRSSHRIWWVLWPKNTRYLLSWNWVSDFHPTLPASNLWLISSGPIWTLNSSRDQLSFRPSFADMTLWDPVFWRECPPLNHPKGKWRAENRMARLTIVLLKCSTGSLMLLVYVHLRLSLGPMNTSMMLWRTSWGSISMLPLHPLHPIIRLQPLMMSWDSSISSTKPQLFLSTLQTCIPSFRHPLSTLDYHWLNHPESMIL